VFPTRVSATRYMSWKKSNSSLSPVTPQPGQGARKLFRHCSIRTRRLQPMDKKKRYSGEMALWLLAHRCLLEDLSRCRVFRARCRDRSRWREIDHAAQSVAFRSVGADASDMHGEQVSRCPHSSARLEHRGRLPVVRHLDPPTRYLLTPSYGIVGMVSSQARERERIRVHRRTRGVELTVTASERVREGQRDADNESEATVMQME